jgi:hypothetical protein
LADIKIEVASDLTFALVPEKNVSSPLDVPTIKARITTPEIVDMVREGRERSPGANGFEP